MKSTRSLIGRVAAIAVLSTVSSVGAPLPAGAQPARGFSCEQLWRQRNAIYARAGHCFSTDRGRATFGEGCYPPYGRLSGADSRQVQRIRRLERMNGC
ncbi:YARHG domain-containing protein [Methylosinus sp. Sm6]|uniref:YARHG domain-containing protein n=1 Tax=Methylosinus sp. Sm6 TaxID=2866948 RepID=UPI001C99AF55|nr:YARHG domain-containing protein [Methylosinus sp. Sm6]MBY6242180.1 YARHG domain-containing protein [Methylosinus sp. Sm6]